MTGWSRRIRPSSGAQDLRQLRDAAQDLANLAPSKARVVFETVADVSLVATAVISGALASIHLWKALFPKSSSGRQPGNLVDDDRNTRPAGSAPPRSR